jgi:hypothetical protein
MKMTRLDNDLASANYCPGLVCRGTGEADYSGAFLSASLLWWLRFEACSPS